MSMSINRHVKVGSNQCLSGHSPVGNDTRYGLWNVLGLQVGTLIGEACHDNH